MDIESTTNSVDGGDTSSDIEANDTGVETLDNATTEDSDAGTDEPQYDDEGNLVEDSAEVEDDSEEIEYEGIKAKVPKVLKDAFLRQADYTKKTQELAEARKAFEAERVTVQQADEQELSALASLKLIDRQLTDYSKVDWNAWHDSDPFEAQKAFAQFTLLKDARTQTSQFLGHISEQRTVQKQQETAKRMEEGAAILAKEIEGWGDQHAAKLMSAAQTHYKFSKEALDAIDDPAVVIALNDAVQWREHQAAIKKTKQLAKGQQFQPAQTLKGTSAKTPIRADTNDFAAFEKYADNKLKA
jgi:hypothetical protein